MQRLCRDCGSFATDDATRRRCPACGSRRLVHHAELGALAIAHIDCDAFYATIEKRDRPELAELPVIVGGRHRGVVLAACYVARRSGVRSAMPMFKALRLCPDAVVVRPDMAKYRAVGHAVRERMRALTPLVQPMSIDEAFLDLAGTERLAGCPPAASLAALARDVEAEHGITVSIGLSYNKFLAKIASDLDKPRGFAVLGRGDAVGFLASRPVALLPGVGPALERRLRADGISTVGQLQAMPGVALAARYGALGTRLAAFAAGDDERMVHLSGVPKSLSAESTFDHDRSALADLAAALRQRADRVSAQLRERSLVGATVVLKLKTADFRLRTRSRTLPAPTAAAAAIYDAGLSLLRPEVDGTAFRLLGLGLTGLAPGGGGDSQADLFARPRRADAALVEAVESIRARMGKDAIRRGTERSRD